MKRFFLNFLVFFLLLPTIAWSDINAITIHWKSHNLSGIKGYKMYYSFKSDMTDNKLACETKDSRATELTCSNITIEKYPIYFSIAAIFKDHEILSNPRLFYPPNKVEDFSATPGNSQITLTWTNPSKGDFSGVMIRYRIIPEAKCTDSDYPASYTDGKLVGIFPGKLGTSGSYIHKELNSELTYCYSVFPYDSYKNYWNPTYASARPLDSKVISNGYITLDEFIVAPISLSNPGEVVDIVVHATAADDSDLSYVYDFGDGKTVVSSTNKISHAYHKGGTFKLIVTINGKNGRSLTASKLIEVNDVNPMVPNSFKSVK